MNYGQRFMILHTDQDHPQEKEMQKRKVAIWGGHTNSCETKRSEKQRRKGTIYPFQCKFQRIVRRDKKAFLSDQCNETEENNRVGKTRDLFKKSRDSKGTFHAKMGKITNGNVKALTEDTKKQEILRRSGKNTQKNCTKKVLMTQRTTAVWSLT